MSNGHDDKGRFTSGNTEGRGRQVTALKRALLEAVTPEDMAEIAKAIAEKAKQGDTKAAELLFNRLLGKPAQTKEPEEPLTLDSFYIDDELPDDDGEAGDVDNIQWDMSSLERHLQEQNELDRQRQTAIAANA